MQKRQTGVKKERGQKQREGQRRDGEVTGRIGYLLFHLRLTYYKNPFIVPNSADTNTHIMFLLLLLFSNLCLLT